MITAPGLWSAEDCINQTFANHRTTRDESGSSISDRLLGSP
jgi:hypothetical protein